MRRARTKKIGPRMASGKFMSKPRYARSVPYKSRKGFRAIASSHPLNRMKRQLKQKRRYMPKGTARNMVKQKIQQARTALNALRSTGFVPRRVGRSYAHM